MACGRDLLQCPSGLQSSDGPKNTNSQMTKMACMFQMGRPGRGKRSVAACSRNGAHVPFSSDGPQAHLNDQNGAYAQVGRTGSESAALLRAAGMAPMCPPENRVAGSPRLLPIRMQALQPHVLFKGDVLALAQTMMCQAHKQGIKHSATIVWQLSMHQSSLQI